MKERSKVIFGNEISAKAYRKVSRQAAEKRMPV